MRNPTADELLASLRQAHADLEAELVRLRQQAVGAGAGGAWSEEFVVQRLALVEQAIAEVSAQTLGPAGEMGLAPQLAQQAYGVGLNVSTRSLLLQGLEAAAPAFADIHTPAMLAIAQEMAEGYQGLYQSILRTETDAYRSAQGHLTRVALATGETSDALIGRFVKEFVGDAKDGRLRLPGGSRNWAIEDYAEMLGRTVSAKAMREAGLNRVAETGNDLVIVIGSEILPKRSAKTGKRIKGSGTCATCHWADGKVFSISGATDRPESVPEGMWGGPLDLLKANRSARRDRIVGQKNSPPVGHPRCVHDFAAYVEGTAESAAEDLRSALEQYAGKLGMEIANGGVQ